MGAFLDQIPIIKGRRRGSYLDIHHQEHPSEFANFFGKNARVWAVISYLETKDSKVFRQHLQDSYAIQIAKIQRLIQENRMPLSHDGYLLYTDCFSGLAVGREEDSACLAKLIQDFLLPTQGEDVLLFRVMVSYLTKDYALCRQCVEELKNFARYNQKPYLGVAFAFKALLMKDAMLGEQALQILLEEHKVLTAERARFYASEDEEIFIWGLGLLNAMRKERLAIAIPNIGIIPNLLII